MLAPVLPRLSIFLSRLTQMLRKTGTLITQPTIVFWTLPWLLILLTLGTLAQREIGLHQAQKLFLSSFFFWIGSIPLPGMGFTISILFIAMVVKFVFYSPFCLARAGIILSHLGVLLLLSGGIITHLSQQEWSITIAENDESNILSDYHQRVLKIYKDATLVQQIPFENIEVNQPLKIQKVKIQGENFTLTPTFMCKNCDQAPPPAEEIPAKEIKAIKRFGIMQKISFKEKPIEKEDSRNLGGIELMLAGLDKEQDGLYATLEDVPMRPSFDTKTGTITLQMSRAETILPFFIRLEEFKKEDYPGTQMARSYSSQVIIKDGELKWPALIRMNEPLRYKGYTFYQSSFIEAPQGNKTILSVVRNKGRIFPYIASGIIFLGLLLHCFILLQQQIRRER